MRRTETLTIPGILSEKAGERDNGKIFVLTEMDAWAGQKWALRMLQALAASGVTLPEGALSTGWAGLAGFGITAFLQAPSAALEPLLDEMIGQAAYQHDPKHPPQLIRPGPNCVVQEIKTFLTIQVALLKLHLVFLPAAAIPTTG